jgi:hypothetical protein
LILFRRDSIITDTDGEITSASRGVKTSANNQ